MERWIDKVAIVTGASSGIGRAIVVELVNQGMKVAALARRTERLEELEKELNKGTHFKGLKCDVTSEEEVTEAINWVETNWGEINVLVNNAAVLIRDLLTEGTENGMIKVIDTNVIGLSRCTRKVVTVMKKHHVEQGHIININSVNGHMIMPTQRIGPYTASKYAVTVLTEILKNELAIDKSPIRVTSLSPGFVITEMTKDFLNLDVPKLNAEDISNCVKFVLSTPQHVNISEITVEPTGECFGATSTQHISKLENK